MLNLVKLEIHDQINIWTNLEAPGGGTRNVQWRSDGKYMMTSGGGNTAAPGEPGNIRKI